jgi:hypothetical protein
LTAELAQDPDRDPAVLGLRRRLAATSAEARHALCVCTRILIRAPQLSRRLEGDARLTRELDTLKADTVELQNMALAERAATAALLCGKAACPADAELLEALRLATALRTDEQARTSAVQARLNQTAAEHPGMPECIYCMGTETDWLMAMPCGHLAMCLPCAAVNPARLRYVWGDRAALPACTELELCSECRAPVVFMARISLPNELDLS